MSQFATASELATLLRRDFEPKEIDAAELILELVSGEIQGCTHQDIELIVDDVVTLHGNYSRELVLPQWPVVSVSAISINGLTVPVGSWLLAGNKLYRGNLNIFNGPDDWGGELWVNSWLGPQASVQVTYTHGFVVIPSDVRGVCLRAAARAMERPEWAAQGNNYARDFVFLTDDDRARLERFSGTI